jgi:hypothetical protein
MTFDLADGLLNDDEHAKLTERINRMGEGRTADSLRISRGSLLRLLSRRPVRLGTISLARIGLSKSGGAA